MNTKIILLILILTNTTYSQWEKTSWRSDEVLNLLSASNNKIIISLKDKIFISSDQGVNWLKAGILPNSTSSFLSKDSTFLSGGFGFLYSSSDYGKTWEIKTKGMPSFPIINELIEIDNKIFAGTNKGVFISYNKGNNWYSKNYGFENGLSISAMINIHNTLVVSTYNGTSGIYFSSDLGETWTKKNNGLPIHQEFRKISKMGNLLIIGTYVDTYNAALNKMFYSTNYGETWIETNSEPFKKEYSYEFAAIGNRILLSVDARLYISADTAKTWINVTSSLPIQLQHGMGNFIVDENVIYTVSGSELYKSTDFGDSWIPIRTAINYGGVYCMISKGNTIYAGGGKHGDAITTYYDGFFKSTDNGNTWLPKGLKNKAVLSLYINNDYLYANTNFGNHLSTDFGESWLEEGAGFPDSSEIWSMAFNSNEIFAACRWEGMKYSNDSGKTWTKRNSGLPLYRQDVISLHYSNNLLFAGLDSSFYTSDDSGLSWVEKNNGLPFSDLIISQIESSGDSLYIVTSQGIYFSSNLGESWSLISSGLPQWWSDHKWDKNCIISLIDKYIFAGIISFPGTGGVFYSSNNGKTWIAKNDGIITRDYSISSIIRHGDYLFAGTNIGWNGEDGDAIYRAKFSDIISDVKDNENKRYIVFPNPAHNQINLSLPDGAFIEHYEIYNSAGKKVGEGKELIAGALDVSALPAGVYYIRCMTNEGMINQKFVVRR